MSSDDSELLEIKRWQALDLSPVRVAAEMRSLQIRSETVKRARSLESSLSSDSSTPRPQTKRESRAQAIQNKNKEDKNKNKKQKK